MFSLVAYLNMTFPSANKISCPTNAEWATDYCQCNQGYKQLDNKTCSKNLSVHQLLICIFIVERWTEKVYPYNETFGENNTGMNDADCKALFGSAAELSANSLFCRCREANISYFDTDKCCMFSRLQLIFSGTKKIFSSF